MKRYIFLGTIATLAMILIFPAFATAKEIKIGLVYPVSGMFASVGNRCVNGHEFAVKEINAKGGIKSLGGAKIKLITADTMAKGEIGMAETEKLIKKEKVVAIFGAWQSSVTFPTTQVAEKYKTPYIVPMAVADSITQRGFKYTFRTNLNASTNAKDAYDLLKWLGEKTGKKAKTVVLLNEDSLWGQSTAKTWKKLAPDYGLTVVGDFPYSKTVTDISPTIAKIKGLKPDCVLQCSYTTDAILITRTMFELNFNCMLRLPSGGGHSDPKFLEGVGNLAENMIMSIIFHPTSKGPGTKVQDANKKFEAIYKHEMDEYVATAYNATWVLIDALERAASTDKDKLRDAIAKTNINMHNSPVIQHYDFNFDENGQCPGAVGTGVQVQNGKRVSIYPEEIAAAKPIYPMPTWKERGLRK